MDKIPIDETKNLLIIKDDAIVKNSMALAKGDFDKPLTINQLRLYYHLILKSDDNGVVKFRLKDFKKMFNLKSYKKDEALRDIDVLFQQNIQMQILDKHGGIDKMEKIHLFEKIQYDKGVFSAVWTPTMLPEIKNIKGQFIKLDISLLSTLNTNAWSLYVYLKTKYGSFYQSNTIDDIKQNIFHFSQNEMNKYNNNWDFINRVLEPSIDLINEYTEFDLSYEKGYKGKKIIEIKFIFYARPTYQLMTDKQIEYIQQQKKYVYEKLMPLINLMYNLEQKEKALNIVNYEITPISESYDSKDINFITSSTASQTIGKLNVNIKLIEKMIEDDDNSRGSHFEDNELYQRKKLGIPDFEPFDIPKFDWSRFE